METYASIKGQTVQPRPVATTAPAAPADDLSDEEIERIAQNRAFVIEHMPELVDFIKALHAEKMIDGWRSVDNCKTHINERKNSENQAADEPQ